MISIIINYSFPLNRREEEEEEEEVEGREEDPVASDLSAWSYLRFHSSSLASVIVST